MTSALPVTATPSLAPQALWDSLLAAWPYGERLLFVAGTFAVHSGVFWGLNLLLFISHKLNLFERYKIQGKKYPPWTLVREALQMLVINHFAVQLVTLWVLWPLFEWSGMRAASPLPSWPVAVRDIVLMFAVNDTLFYWAHRLLHHPRIYKHVHKQHHKFNVTVGIAAEYAHPVEGVLANQIPTVAGALLLGTHMSTFWLYLAIRIHETVDAHSGYDFPLSPWRYAIFSGADRHDFHHSHNTGVYGGAPTVFWDWLCGTDRPYLQWKAAAAAEHAAAAAQAAAAGKCGKESQNRRGY